MKVFYWTFGQKRLLIVVFLVMFLLSMILIHYDKPVVMDRKLQLQKIDKLIRNQTNGEACRLPNLPVNYPEIMKLMRKVAPIDCSKAAPDWVTCKGSECYIDEQMRTLHGKIVCAFTDLIRRDDYNMVPGETTYSDLYYRLENSDLVEATCNAQNGQRWSSVLTGIRLNKRIWDQLSWEFLPENSLKLNVLMFGLDSLSRNTFIRKLPKSYDYLTNELKAVVLEGYNIVGDGTPQAVIPILTGKTELELPDTRKRMKNSSFVNVYPFVWNEFKNAGYATAFFEDKPVGSIFTYRLRGFDNPPTDHYMRPYYLAISPKMSKWPDFCSGSTPRHNVMLNSIKSFFKVYKTKPKFLFGFHGELSHDSYDLVETADSDLTKFLESLNNSGALNNTMLIIMSDHGHRFATVRDTLQGKQEERLPFFSFTFPRWFKTVYKEAYQNFLGNTKRLTTPFDIHATLKDVLGLESVGSANLSLRSLSLFSQIPKERNCALAQIEPHWCACLEWYKVELSEPIVAELGNHFVSTINDYTKNYRNRCEYLSIARIIWVMVLKPNDGVIKFLKSADHDGFVPDLSGKTVIKTNTYQIKIILKPGYSIFEATMTHSIDDNRLNLKMSDISRVNMYGAQAKCIETEFPDLRKYCYCKD